MKRFYITTAIDYANGAPHLGHAYEKVLADVIARYRRMMGESVHFLTGLDEHGQKVQQSARIDQVEPQDYVDGIAELFLALCQKLEISNDDFIRTTEPRHKDAVRRVLADLYARGEIYKSNYLGYYSVRQEQFVLEKEKVDGKWPEIYGEIIQISEPNYFFRISKYQDWLLEFLNSTDFVVPAFRQKQVVEFLKEPLNDLCISRPKERLAWGIPLPFDEEYVTYVWFDALLNYATAVGLGTEKFSECWPCDIHVIGKDILVPAHAVYWPIMLKAMGVELPKSLLVHGWWQINGEKMSKSTGQTVDPIELASVYGSDVFRYFVIREMNVGQDGDFSMGLFLSRYNGELANALGNLVSRVLTLTTAKSCPYGLPAVVTNEQLDLELHTLWNNTKTEVLQHYETFHFHIALEKIFVFITALNRYVDNRAPWKLVKSALPYDQALFQTTIANLAEGIRLSAAFLAPVMPSTAQKIYGLLGLGNIGLWKDELNWSTRLTGNKMGDKVILFPRLP
ncbi:MAG: class I tRNA ligase family protein [Verrucomicrobiota bacterium]|nr:class I tRNA ligase family protein [Verrucomicrobiota bacterium]